MPDGELFQFTHTAFGSPLKPLERCDEPASNLYILPLRRRLTVGKYATRVDGYALTLEGPLSESRLPVVIFCSSRSAAILTAFESRLGQPLGSTARQPFSMIGKFWIE